MNDLDRPLGPQAAVCTQWMTDIAGRLATETAGAPSPISEVFSALLAQATVSLGVGIALAQHDRAWALAAVRQLTVLQEQLLAPAEPAALPAIDQRGAYLDIARRLIAQAPLPADSDAPNA